jgi:hypothetical protein
MKRPVGVTIFAVLLMAAAVAHISLGTITAWDKGLEYRIRGEPPWVSAIPVVARIALGLIYGLIGAGLWNLRRWARGAFLLWTMSGATVAVVMLILSRAVPRLGLWTPPLWIWILILVYAGMIFYYFMRTDVKRAFGIQ